MNTTTLLTGLFVTATIIGFIYVLDKKPIVMDAHSTVDLPNVYDTNDEPMTVQDLFQQYGILN